MQRSTTPCSVARVNSVQALAALERAPAAPLSERLRAARFLARNAAGAQKDRLSRIRVVEHNSWVRKALDHALKRCEAGMSSVSFAKTDEVSETILDRHLQEELHAQAIEETSALFLHELRPLIGLLEAAASDEIGHYESSRTRSSLERVRSLLEGIERLRKASAPVATQDFDLTDLVVRIAADETKQGRAILDSLKEKSEDGIDLVNGLGQQSRSVPVRLLLAREDPVMTTGDPTLIEMALANALRNAIEAVLEVSDSKRADVTLNWGVTDSDGWVVVLDNGCGLPPGWERMAKVGTSTKKSEGHLGMGLPIAQRAIESTRGSIVLMPRPNGGVACEIRWPNGGAAE